jgi:signal transduction histidine kinase
MWGVLSLVTVKYGTPIDHLFITVIIAGASAGSVATVSAIFSAFSVFFLFAVFPVFVSFLMSNVHFLQVTSPLILFFIGIIFSAGKIFHQNMINSILLSRQLTDLNVKLQLEQAKTQQSNEAKSRFISSMSHELRTPLNSIIGFTQLTKLSDSLSEDDLENIEQIDVASQKLLELINNVLYLSNMMSDDVEVQLDMTSIQDEIHRAKNILEHEILKNVITVTCDVDDLTVNADSNLLLQVIIQLFTNAIRYNKMGGKLHIEAHVTPENHVKVSFTDSGKGIHPDYQDKLFTPFERLGEEAGSAAGLGLGLYISKTYIDKMHGHIGYETEHLVGSTFWFELPIFNSKHKES